VRHVEKKVGIKISFFNHIKRIDRGLIRKPTACSLVESQ